MLTKRMQDELNLHINREFYSWSLYLSMSAYFSDIGLAGFANWMSTQAMEEMEHGRKIYDFVNSRRGRAELHQIDKPKFEWSSAKNVFEEALAHEQFITKSVNDLVQIAKEEQDNATEVFLQWFVTEQVEEESNADDIVNQLRMVGDSPGGLFILDRELGSRQA